MPPATSGGHPGSYAPDAAYPSRNIAFQAAGMITSIIENLQEHDHLQYTPAFMYVLSLYAAVDIADLNSAFIVCFRLS